MNSLNCNLPGPVGLSVFWWSHSRVSKTHVRLERLQWLPLTVSSPPPSSQSAPATEPRKLLLWRKQLLWQSCEWWWVWKFFHGDVEVPLVARALLRVRTDVWNSESLQRAKSGSNTVAFVLCEKYFVQQTPPLTSKTQTPLKSNASKKQSEQTEAFLDTKQEPISVVIFLSTRCYFCVPALSIKNNNYYCYCSKDPFIYKIYNYTNADAIRNELILRADRDLKVKRDPL